MLINDVGHFYRPRFAPSDMTEQEYMGPYYGMGQDKLVEIIPAEEAARREEEKNRPINEARQGGLKNGLMIGTAVGLGAGLLIMYFIKGK